MNVQKIRNGLVIDHIRGSISSKQAGTVPGSKVWLAAGT